MASFRDIIDKLVYSSNKVESNISDMNSYILQIRPFIGSEIQLAVRRLEIEGDIDRINLILDRIYQRLPRLQELLINKSRLIEELENQVGKVIKV
jgi:hypothetical protein